MKLILSLFVPLFPIAVPPDPRPQIVVVDEAPEIIQFFTVQLVTGSPAPVVANQIPAAVVTGLVLINVRLREAEVSGQREFSVVAFEPSMVTLSAPFINKSDVAEEPEIVVVPVGFIMSDPEPRNELMVIGKVSEG